MDDGRKNKMGVEILSNITISEILHDPVRYDGELVEIDGLYMGWHGNLSPLSRGATRSDWILEDGNDGGIFVSAWGYWGPESVGPPYDSTSPEYAGSPVILRGLVCLDHHDKPFILPISGEGVLTPQVGT